jgi:hypothetical protein
MLLDDVSNFILGKENEYFSNLSSYISERLLPQLPAGVSGRQASQRYFPFVFTAPNKNATFIYNINHSKKN